MVDLPEADNPVNQMTPLACEFKRFRSDFDIQPLCHIVFLLLYIVLESPLGKQDIVISQFKFVNNDIIEFSPGNDSGGFIPLP